MAKWALLVLLVSFVVWRYLPRARVTWVSVVVLFGVVLGLRFAQQHWS